jgi:threonine aldolase
MPAMKTDTLPPVDLRSDTFTKPTPAMRAAMAAAEVGDDVWGEDPTVGRLEARAAEVTGKEAAIYCASGTMANSLAMRLHAESGDEVLMHELSHPFHHESGSPASLWGLTIRPLPGPAGLVDPAALRDALHPEVRYMSRQRLFWLENTHNGGGGTVEPLDHLEEVCGIARGAGLAIHHDGARVFNASVASGVPVARFAAFADTISFCLSKGLGAPVGSMLCGPAQLIDRARRFRHMLGGGWRQAGVLAAAGLHALDHHVERLADDHRRTAALAAAIGASGVARVPVKPQTNILLFAPLAGRTATDLVDGLAARGVLVSEVAPGVVRAVFHLDVDEAGAERAAAAVRSLIPL